MTDFCAIFSLIKRVYVSACCEIADMPKNLIRNQIKKVLLAYNSKKNQFSFGNTLSHKWTGYIIPITHKWF